MGKMGMVAAIAVLLLASVAFAGAVAAKKAYQPKPDITVVKVWLEQNPNSKELANTVAVVKNVGTATSLENAFARVGFYRGGVYLGDEHIPALAPGESTVVYVPHSKSFLCPPTPAPFKLTAEVSGVVDETNTANNIMSVLASCNGL